MVRVTIWLTVNIRIFRSPGNLLRNVEHVQSFPADCNKSDGRKTIYNFATTSTYPATSIPLYERPLLANHNKFLKQ